MEQSFQIDLLIAAAFTAREQAYCPYSNFAVGAALLGKSGQIYPGCNVENAAFSPSICAERTAVASAVVAGEREFVMLAIVGGDKDKKEGELGYSYPCGVCRQVLHEFCAEDFPVIVAASADDYQILTLGELLPHAFSTY